MSDHRPKYDTLMQLHDAINAGEVTGTLMIDNDAVSMYDEATDTDLFEMHPSDLLVQALDLLGIPHEYV
jgi:hypothetical protein